jgi:malate dehydrogenase
MSSHTLAPNPSIIKIAVTGAAGQIDYAFLFRLASGQIFGPHVRLDLRLLDITPALPMLDAVVKELEDCAFSSLYRVTITDNPDQAFKEVSWAILVGSAPRKAGMERSDLLQMNGQIFAIQGRSLNEQAGDDVRIFVVGNPCNTNALIAMNHAPRIPKERFYAMTRLDQNRAMMQLALKAKVEVDEVKNMIIWGNHSSTQYPDFYNTTIHGQPVTQIIDENWLKDEFVPLIQTRGAAVIKARGSSSAASAANGIVDSVSSFIHDTPEGESYSVAVCSRGQYGIDEGLIFSCPCRTVKGQLKVIEGIEHNEFGKAHIQTTLNELRQEYKTVKDLKLI